MIKKTIFTAAMVLAGGCAFAQTEQSNSDFTETVEYSTDKYKVETNRFWDNWFISAGAGGQVYFGDHDRQRKFGERISPALDIAVGKWFTPGIGVRLMYSGLSAKGATQNGAYQSGGQISGKPWHGYWLNEQKFKFFNFHMDAMFNLMNIIGGYKEKRIYSLSPYAGVGIARVTSKPKNAEITGHLGFMNSFRLCSALDLNLDLRATFINDMFDGEVGGRGGEPMLTAALGLTYKFKQRGWDRSKTITRNNDGALKRISDQIDALNAENARLQRELADAKNRPTEVIKKFTSGNLLIFRIGESKLSKEARVNLQFFAEAIKAGDPNALYTITGYADAGTGSKKTNERLSKKRAEAVRDCLVNEFGVSESQLEIDYKGGVDNMFYDDPRLSRAVITRSK